MMIISNKQVQSITKVYREQNKTASGTATPTSGTARKPDQVILSSGAQEFGHILQSIKNLPDVRTDRVVELSNRIAAGSYNVTSHEVVEKMFARLQADSLR